LTQALERIGAGPPKVKVEAFGKNLQPSVVARGAGFGLLPASQLTAIAPKRRIRAFNVPDFQVAVSTWFIRRPQLGGCRGRWMKSSNCSPASSPNERSNVAETEN
jgi:hypothetical protein